MTSPGMPVATRSDTPVPSRPLWGNPGRLLRHVLFWVVVVIAGNILLLELMLTLSGQMHKVGFTERFDDPALRGWEHVGDVKVTRGALQVEPGGGAFVSYDWGNVSFSVRARRWGNGALTLRYRAGDGGGYDVRFGDLEVSLTRFVGDDVVELASVPVSIPAGVWVTVHVIAVGNFHAVTLDGKTILKCDDPNPFSTHMIGLLNIGPGWPTGEFDDLEILGDSNPEVVVARSPTPEIPSPSP